MIIHVYPSSTQQLSSVRSIFENYALGRLNILIHLPCNHDLTYILLNKESWFRKELDLFIAGKPRFCCSECFLIVILSFRLIPCVETTIEEKHARTTLENKRHPVGPVRISLANRLPWLERQLSKHPEKISEFLSCFEKVRNLEKMAVSFGIDQHCAAPCNVDSTQKHTRWQARVLFSKIVYHNDSYTCQRSLKIQMKTNANKRQKQAREYAKHSAVETPGKAGGLTQVLRTSLREHVQNTFSAESFFSVAFESGCQLIRPEEYYAGRSSASVSAYATLSESGSMHVTDHGDDELQSAIVPMHPSPCSRSELFFQVGSMNLSNKKVIRTAPGAGRTMRHSSFTIIAHRPCFRRCTDTLMSVAGNRFSHFKK